MLIAIKWAASSKETFTKPQKAPTKSYFIHCFHRQDANDDHVLHTALVAGKEIEVHTSCNTKVQTEHDEKGPEHGGLGR